jgi:hypothetical protein
MEDINFDFRYEDLIKLPLFMIKDIYKFYDELIEEKDRLRKATAAVSTVQ